LPNAPEKALVLTHCSVCHDIDWVVMSGGTVEGWTSRLQRMIRAGATIPKDQIPAVAAYLAKAFPPRPRSDTPP
jgi:mono/diheme cytochrome c family protein